MILDALRLAWLDATNMLRRRETQIWTFVMPIVFFYFLGTIVGYGRAADNTPITIEAASDAGFLVDILIEKLQRWDFGVAVPKSHEEFLKGRRRLTIPAGYTTSVLNGQSQALRFDAAGQDQGAELARFGIERAALSLAVDRLALSRAGAPLTREEFTRLAREKRTLTLDVKTAGTRVDPPTGFEQSVPGTMVMFTLLVLFTTGSVSLTVERSQGILRRLASSALPRGAVVFAKWLARMMLGVVQIAFAMGTGSVLFHVRWGANLPMIALVMLVYGSLAAILGMLLGNFGRNEGQVVGMGVIASNLLAGLGGCWWPIEVAPMWAQRLALFTPTGWTMDALHKLVNFGQPAAVVVPHVAVTAAVVLIAGAVLTRTFRFQ